MLQNIDRGIAEVWERGFCISMGALDPGSNAVGVPYLHPDGRHVLGFNLTAPKSVLTRKAIDTKWGPKLLDLVQQVQRLNFGTPDSGFHSNVNPPIAIKLKGPSRGRTGERS